METVDERPIVSDVAPGDIRRRLPASAPEQGEPFEDIMRDLDDIVMPGITHWQSPGWFAYFPRILRPPPLVAAINSSGRLWSLIDEAEETVSE